MAGNLEMWSALVGWFLPMLIAVIQQPRWSNTVRSVVTVIVCVITGFVTTWLTVDFDFSKDLVASILTVLIAAQASYLAFFKPTKVAPAIERATSGGDSGP